ncbi:MAG TPA: hypothetical protein VEJ89_13475 [Myxococcaceae bacterium]|jgi:hypothetical protein|nr:hypothetical protein [Myxococcaceae bacterium]
MMPDLAALFPAPPPPRPEHAAALESELLRRFDARPAPARRAVLSRPVRRLAFGSLLVAGLAAASQAPVDRAVVVGHRFTIALPAGAALPPPDALSDALRGPAPAGPGAYERQVALRVSQRDGEGPTVVADVWSDVPPADVEARLRALPDLAGAAIGVSPLEGRMHESLARWLGHDLLDLPSDPASVEAARQKLQAELAARGEQGQVDVQVDDSQPGQKRVMVKVTKDAEDDGAAAGAR